TMLIGPRYLNLDQKLIINDSRQDLPGLGNPGNSFFFQDNFTTYNRFYGGQVGLEGECRIGCFVLTLTGKVAVGENDMISKISGNTIITEPDGTVTTSNTRAVLVQPSNVGEQHLKKIGVIPAGEAYVGYDFNEYVRLSIGYSFIYWFDILRPGN